MVPNETVYVFWSKYFVRISSTGTQHVIEIDCRLCLCAGTFSSCAVFVLVVLFLLSVGPKQNYFFLVFIFMPFLACY